MILLITWGPVSEWALFIVLVLSELFYVREHKREKKACTGHSSREAMNQVQLPQKKELNSDIKNKA